MSVQPIDSPYPLSQGHQSQTVVVTQPQVTVVQHFREAPVRITCQYCSSDVITATTYELGTFTWIACAVIFFVGCYLGCCLIPFCLNACKDVVHSCPNCQQVVGRYNRM